jgi:hypothetical protein
VVPGRVRRPGAARRRAGLATVTAAAAVLSLAGCAKMDASLDKQWITVDFSPNTTPATALHVRAACSHVHNTPPLPIPAKQNTLTIMYGVEYNTTNSSPANIAELQLCLGKFKSVLGVDPQDTGDEGS